MRQTSAVNLLIRPVGESWHQFLLTGDRRPAKEAGQRVMVNFGLKAFTMSKRWIAKAEILAGVITRVLTGLRKKMRGLPKLVYNTMAVDLFSYHGTTTMGSSQISLRRVRTTANYFSLSNQS